VRPSACGLSYIPFRLHLREKTNETFTEIMDDEIWTYAVVLWVALAGLLGEWQRRNGGSFIAGALTSMIFSPLIAVIIIATMRPNKAVIEKRQITGGGMKKCPACAELIKAEATKCRFCGEKVA